MRCLGVAAPHTHDHAYSRRIERLMLTGNFPLVVGVSPRKVEH